MFKSFSRPLKTLGLAAVVSVSALATQAQARGPGFGPGPDMGGPPPMMWAGPALKDAGVSDAQRTQLKQIFDAARNDLKGQRETMRSLHERAQALFVAPTVDANAVEQVRAQIAAQQDTASKRMSLAMIEASRVLTPEQRVKIAESIKQHRARMEERMKDRKDGKGPRGPRDGNVPPPFTDR
ncbi:MAG: Spy/CpxP family protein refolding chaperone [Burkholderiaceae bacterium]